MIHTFDSAVRAILRVEPDFGTEILSVRVEGEILVWDWHTVDCPQFQNLIAD